MTPRRTRTLHELETLRKRVLVLECQLEPTPVPTSRHVALVPLKSKTRVTDNRRTLAVKTHLGHVGHNGTLQTPHDERETTLSRVSTAPTLLTRFPLLSSSKTSLTPLETNGAVVESKTSPSKDVFIAKGSIHHNEPLVETEPVPAKVCLENPDDLNEQATPELHDRIELETTSPLPSAIKELPRSSVLAVKEEKREEDDNCTWHLEKRKPGEPLSLKLSLEDSTMTASVSRRQYMYNIIRKMNHAGLLKEDQVIYIFNNY